MCFTFSFWRQPCSIALVEAETFREKEKQAGLIHMHMHMRTHAAYGPHEPTSMCGAIYLQKEIDLMNIAPCCRSGQHES